MALCRAVLPDLYIRRARFRKFSRPILKFTCDQPPFTCVRQPFVRQGTVRVHARSSFLDGHPPVALRRFASAGDHPQTRSETPTRADEAMQSARRHNIQSVTWYFSRFARFATGRRTLCDIFRTDPNNKLRKPSFEIDERLRCGRFGVRERASGGVGEPTMWRATREQRGIGTSASSSAMVSNKKCNTRLIHRRIFSFTFTQISTPAFVTGSCRDCNRQDFNSHSARL